MVFTQVDKNESLGINLLMEKQFQKLLFKTKVQKDQKDPLFKSFEGALFLNSAWFFHFQDAILPLVEKINPPMKIDELKPAEPALASLSEVLFVGDTYTGKGEDLLGKMIVAMKLNGNEFYRYPMEEELEDVVELEKNLQDPSSATLNLLNIIQNKRPKVVVSLGATVTNILLGKREKLSTIHGQFIEKQTGPCVYSLVPIFHPDFLLINPNMKRTAWIDLQKVMERVGKI